MDAFKVGLMALASMAAIVYISVRVTSNQSGFGNYITYQALVRDASGIFSKTPIRIAGVNAGRVVGVALKDNNALVTFEVREDIVVSKDSTLRIRAVGFFGDKYLEILLGNERERLPEGGLIVSEESGGMENIVKDVSEILVDVRRVVGEIKDSLAPEEGLSPIREVIASVRELVDNTRKATEVMRDLALDNEEKINQMVDNLEQFSAQLQYQVDGQNHDSAMATVGEILGNVKETTADLKKVVFDIKSGKGTLGKILREDKIADEVTETLAGVNKLVNKVSMIKTELEMFTGSNTSYGADSFVNLKVYPSPERFYLLGLVTSEFGVAEEKRYTTNVGGVETVWDETVREKDTFRFNFQLGRQFNNWVFRGGLIESTGGLGVDYRFSRWNQYLGAELFDYREGLGPNLRLSSELQIWNIIYGKVSLEDTILSSRSATLSVGLKFADEDIRGLAAFFIK